MNKRLLFGALAGVTAFAAVNGSAASLGGDTGITDSGIGAGSKAVASCDTDGVETAYTTAYNASAAGYEVDDVTVGSIASGCQSKRMRVTLVNASNTSLGEVVVDSLAAGQVGTGTATLDFAAPHDVLAANVTKVHVVIGG